MPGPSSETVIHASTRSSSTATAIAVPSGVCANTFSNNASMAAARSSADTPNEPRNRWQSQLDPASLIFGEHRPERDALFHHADDIARRRGLLAHPPASFPNHRADGSLECVDMFGEPNRFR